MNGKDIRPDRRKRWRCLTCKTGLMRATAMRQHLSEKHGVPADAEGVRNASSTGHVWQIGKVTFEEVDRA